MKKYTNTAFAYGIVAMVAGVFYREFTKYTAFEGKTSLSVVHTHLFALGMMMFLLVGLYCDQYKLYEKKQMKLFYPIYNAGLTLTAVMFVVRGVLQVLEVSLSKGMNAAISGMAGIGHMLLGIGIICFFLAIKEIKK